MNRVLVTGASGFIGRALAQDLGRRGWSVVASSRTAVAGLPEGVVNRVLPDLRQPIDWASCIEDVDAVVHVAGIAHATRRISAEEYHRVNVVPTEHLAQASARRGIHMVFMSSVRAQTGPSADHALTEDEPAVPSDDYGRSKLAAEHAIRRSGARHTVLRPTLVYGDEVRGNLAALLRLAALPLPLPFGALENRRSLLSVRNLTDAVALVLENGDAEGEIYLGADPDPLTMCELLAVLRAGLNRRPHLVRVPPPLLAAALGLMGRGEDWLRIGGSLIVDNAKLCRAGWTPRHATRDGLLAMAAAYAQRRAAAPA